MATDPAVAVTPTTRSEGETERAGYQQPDVDVSALQVFLDGPHREVRERVRSELAARAGVLVDAEQMSRADFRERVKDVVVEMAGTGLPALNLPSAYGGGGDIGGAVAAFETMGFSDLSVLVKVGVQFGLCGGAIHQLGTRTHHEKYLPGIADGSLLGCFAMSETGHGSNVQALGTTATYDPGSEEFVIHTPHDSARKEYIGNAGQHGEIAVVFAQLEVAGQRRGVHAFVVPIRVDGEPAPGVRIEDDGAKMGLNGVDNARLWFDQVRVPREALLNQYADVSPEGEYTSPIEGDNKRFFTMLGTLVQGRVCVGGAGINAAKVALTIAVRYGDRRRQFEATSSETEELLLDYGLHQRRLFPLLARTYALHCAQETLAAQLHEVFTDPDATESQRRGLEARAAGTKALGTWHATRTIQECREACGGAGYLSENRFAALKADTDVFTTFEGDNHVLLQLVAKGLLTDYSSEFEDADQFELVRFVASMAVDTVIEKTRAHKLLIALRDVLPGDDTWDQEAGLLDPHYHLAMFRFREEHMLAGAARRLKRGTDEGREPGEVFSQVQPHVIAAARAHVQRLVLEAFVAKVQAMPPGDNRVAVTLLSDLYALSTIEENAAWFAEHGRLTAQRSKAITREIDDLCRKIRPVAVDLMDAFGVPEAMLRAEGLLRE